MEKSKSDYLLKELKKITNFFKSKNFKLVIERSKKLLNNIGFNVQTLARQNLAHGLDPEGISKGMEFLKSLN